MPRLAPWVGGYVLTHVTQSGFSHGRHRARFSSEEAALAGFPAPQVTNTPRPGEHTSSVPNVLQYDGNGVCQNAALSFSCTGLLDPSGDLNRAQVWIFICHGSCHRAPARDSLLRLLLNRAISRFRSYGEGNGLPADAFLVNSLNSLLGNAVGDHDAAANRCWAERGLTAGRGACMVRNRLASAGHRVSSCPKS